MNFSPDESFAHNLDAADPLRAYRDRFLIPQQVDGRPVRYFCGHSLGLQPATVRAAVEAELDHWAELGVEGHFQGVRPWYSYEENFRTSGARLVGALPGEVVMMNSLTVNLHLMLATFYRPTPGRHKILIDEPVFPSDLYALQSVLQLHGFDTKDSLVSFKPDSANETLDEDRVEEFLRQRGHEIALVLWNGVNFLTGQFFDLARLTRVAQAQGCVVGLELAHAAGNVPLRLHDWNVDFAVWCSYKYLNAGPGGVGGCFVHERHGDNAGLPRLAGWWGNDAETRFQMPERFVPSPGAFGWQVSNAPVLAMAALRAALAIFDEVGMTALRTKSEQLTGYLEYLLDRLPPGQLTVLTPRHPAKRGCALSLVIHDRARELQKALHANGAICDFREPNVIRVAPVPLYNTFTEVWDFVTLLSRQL